MPGARALRIFALQRLRDPADIFDDLEPALHVAPGVGENLAVLGGQQLGELVHVGFDELLVIEHDPGALLRVGRRPGRLRRLGGVDRALRGRRRCRASPWPAPALRLGSNTSPVRSPDESLVPPMKWSMSRNMGLILH